MAKTKAKTPVKKTVAFAPLAIGQIWRVDGMDLLVNKIGPLTVQYRLAKPAAVKGSNEIQAKAVLETYLKKQKAVLLSNPAS